MGTIIGDRIGILLIERGIKQKELAQRIGVADNIISYFVKGTRTPNMQQTVDIADFFDVSTDYLLGRTDIRTADVQIKQICKITGLSEKAYKTLRGAKDLSNHTWDVSSSAYNCFLDMIEEDYYFRMCVFLSNAIAEIKRINSYKKKNRTLIEEHIKKQIADDSNYDWKRDSRLVTEFLDKEEQLTERSTYSLWKLETGVLDIIGEYVNNCMDEKFIDYGDFIKECVAHGKHNKEE